MKQYLVILLSVALLCAAVFGLPLLIGIWVPDVFLNSRHTLAETNLPSGHSFHVIQYWNHVDFYNTELIHSQPNGTSERTVLDADDNKTWRVGLVVNESNKTATITLGGGRVKNVDW